eukprot:8439644-Prorocentrum_lima.AAC.1
MTFSVVQDGSRVLSVQQSRGHRVVSPQSKNEYDPKNLGQYQIREVNNLNQSKVNNNLERDFRCNK